MQIVPYCNMPSAINHQRSRIFFFFFFNDTAPPEIYTLSLHAALPICLRGTEPAFVFTAARGSLVHRIRRLVDPAPAASSPPWMAGVVVATLLLVLGGGSRLARVDRKSTRLNSSHSQISYAVFCLKTKK